MHSITFYSYKGGVGRSLALSNIATRLSELNKSVCVLDFDLEAPSLNYKFAKYSKAKEIERGIVDYIDDVVTNGKSDISIKDYSIELIAHNIYATKIQLIPAGNISTGSYWHKLSLINWSNFFYKEEGQGVRFFLNLKEKIKKEINPDFLLIDSRTGITDIAGITLRLLADSVVILAANNLENKEGSFRIIKSLLNKENELFGHTPKINFVLTRIPFTHIEYDKEKRLVNELKNKLKNEFTETDIPISVIHSDRRLEENEQDLIGYEIEEGFVKIENDYLNLFDIICKPYLTKEEVEKFTNKKKAERHYLRALEEERSVEKIELLNNAIKLDPSESEYYELRGYAYSNQGNYSEALEDWETALRIDPTSKYTLIKIGNIYSYKLNQEETALQHFHQALVIDPTFEFAYISISFTLIKLNRFNEAFKALTFLLTNINPDNNRGLNLRANIQRKNKHYDAAYQDIYKAMALSNSNANYYCTLAEINFDEGKVEQFYLNLGIAFSMGAKEAQMQDAKDVYQKVKDEPRFIALLEKYNLDIDEILSE